MKKEKEIEKIVCDVVGCGNLATHKLTFNNGATYRVCDNCFKELAKVFKEEK